jgi:hypothetical protein
MGRSIVMLVKKFWMYLWNQTITGITQFYSLKIVTSKTGCFPSRPTHLYSNYKLYVHQLVDLHNNIINSIQNELFL